MSTINKRLLIYVAGPYLAALGRFDTETLSQNALRHIMHKCVRETALNVERATQVALQVMKLGHAVYWPHASHFLHTRSDVEFDNDYWYDFDNIILDRCDALVIVDTTGVNGVTSKGTIAEIARAKAHGLQVFASVDEIPRYKK